MNWLRDLFLSLWDRIESNIESNIESRRLQREERIIGAPRLLGLVVSGLAKILVIVLVALFLLAIAYFAINGLSKLETSKSPTSKPLSSKPAATTQSSPSGSSTTVERPIPGVKKLVFDRLLKEGRVIDLLAYIDQNPFDESGGLPGQIANLKAQITIADRIVELDSQTSESLMLPVTQVLRMDAVMRLDKLHRQHELNNDFSEREFEEYIVPRLSDSNAEVAEKAHLCMCFSLCHKYLDSPTKENFQKMQQQFEDSLDFAIDSFPLMQKLVEIFKLVDPSASNDARQLLIVSAEKICQSSQPPIQLIGNALLDHVLFADDDVQRLAMEISFNDTGSIDRGIQFIEKVAAENRAGEQAYSTAILLVELIDRIGDRESLKPAVAKLVQSVPNLQRAESTGKIQKMVDEFLVRWELEGKPFRLVATGTERVDFSSCTGNRVVVIFFDSTPQSRDALESAAIIKRHGNEDVSFVAVEHKNSDDALEQEDLEIARQELQSQFPRFIFVELKYAGELHIQCPVRTGPFLILLDKNHEVEANNVNPDKLRKLIEK